MWNKIVKVKFLKQKVDVLIYLNTTKAMSDKEEVVIRSMLNECYLIEKVLFENRDAAYDFIKDFTITMGKSFVTRTAYENGAVE